MPRSLAIITVNYNNAAGLKATIQSVINQTYQDYEYIIIDGGSNDTSVEVIRTFKTKINYWVSEKDNGIYHAMNKGILKASSEYCLFLNSGDTLVEDNILAKLCENKFEEDIVYCDAYFTRKGKLISKYKLPDKLSLYFLLFNSICHQSTFIKRTFLMNSGMYNEKNKLVSDWEFIIRSVYNTQTTFKHIPIAISNYEFDGLWNSDPHLTSSERNLVIDSILPKIIQDDYNQFYNVTQNKIVLLSNNLSLNFSKKIVLFIIKTLSKLEKLFRW